MGRSIVLYCIVLYLFRKPWNVILHTSLYYTLYIYIYGFLGVYWAFVGCKPNPRVGLVDPHTFIPHSYYFHTIFILSWFHPLHRTLQNSSCQILFISYFNYYSHVQLQYQQISQTMRENFDIFWCFKLLGNSCHKDGPLLIKLFAFNVVLCFIRWGSSLWQVL